MATTLHVIWLRRWSPAGRRNSILTNLMSESTEFSGRKMRKPGVQWGGIMWYKTEFFWQVFLPSIEKTFCNFQPLFLYTHASTVGDIVSKTPEIGWRSDLELCIKFIDCIELLKKEMIISSTSCTWHSGRLRYSNHQCFLCLSEESEIERRSKT